MNIFSLLILEKHIKALHSLILRKQAIITNFRIEQNGLIFIYGLEIFKYLSEAEITDNINLHYHLFIVII